MKDKVYVDGVRKYKEVEVLTLKPDENGNTKPDFYYQYYKSELVDGKLVVDLVAENLADLQKMQTDVKELILKAISTMRVEIDGISGKTIYTKNLEGTIAVLKTIDSTDLKIHLDGDEKSQDRMNRAIQNMIVGDEIQWKLYDNTWTTLTQTEIGKAARDAGFKQAELWQCINEDEIISIIGSDTVWLDKYKGV